MEPIAIIGLAFKLPQGVEDEHSFWDMLKKGENAMTPWPPSRTNVDALFQPGASTNNEMQPKGAHFLRQDPAVFDALFFSISSKEAASMDPQQRLLLETTYHAMESGKLETEQSWLVSDPRAVVVLSNLGMLSPDGVCYSFDRGADGYGRGEGSIVLVLKTLSDAVASRDNIHAVIQGTGSNQDGRTPGITQPTFVSQEKLTRQLYRECNLGFEPITLPSCDM